MVDYIFGVSSPVDWHAKVSENIDRVNNFLQLYVANLKLSFGNCWMVVQNLEQNPRHYSSWLAWFGGRGVCSCRSDFLLVISFCQLS
jgi:hypothetical protein